MKELCVAKHAVTNDSRMPFKSRKGRIYCAATMVPKLSGLRTPSTFLEIAEGPTECCSGTRTC